MAATLPVTPSRTLNKASLFSSSSSFAAILNSSQIPFICCMNTAMEDIAGAYSVFFDLSYQIAWRRFNHRKFWNVIIHVVTGWLAAWPLLSMGTRILPFLVHILLIFVKLLICIAQDLKLGAIYSFTYILVAYHALTAEVTFTQAFIILLFAIGFQIGVGHFMVESEQPVVLERDGDVIFIVTSIMNDLFLAPFHFTILVLMRWNMLQDLQWKSDLHLKKLIEEISGKKSP